MSDVHVRVVSAHAGAEASASRDQPATVMYRLGGRRYPLRSAPQCLAGETRYLTKEGVKTLAETVGTKQWVLTAKFAKSRTDLTPSGIGDRRTAVPRGRWVEAEIRSFGMQELRKVTLTRNKVEKVIYATPGHRWFVRTSRSWMSERTTDELRVAYWSDRNRVRPGGTLSYLFPRTAPGVPHPSPFGIAHGFTFGDGSLQTPRGQDRGKGGSQVCLHGEKDAALLKYFDGCRMTVGKTTPLDKGTGQLYTEVRDLPRFFKEFPNRNESYAYLYGWLAGYFAADGSVSMNGNPVLWSASRENLEFVRDICIRLGIGTMSIGHTMRLGKGKTPTALYYLGFVVSTLHPNFFIGVEHRRRFEDRQERGNRQVGEKVDFERLGWTVVSVEATDRFEEVFCAVVPETHSFVLEDNIWIGNCHVCQSFEYRQEIESGLLKSYSVAAIHRSLPPESGISIDSIRNHLNNGHLPLDAAMRRVVIEERAREIGLSVEDHEGALADHITFAKLGVQSVVERMASGELVPDMKDGIALAGLLARVQETAGEGVDNEVMVQAFMVYWEAVRDLMTPEQIAELGRRIEGNPVMASLRNRALATRAIPAETNGH